jgi:hypothetical protein
MHKSVWPALAALAWLIPGATLGDPLATRGGWGRLRRG